MTYAATVINLLVFFLGPLGLPSAAAPVPEYGFQVLHIYPHDSSAFTQGLEFRAGYLYESTGLHGHSSLRREDLQTGKVLQEIHLPFKFFGEGITVLNEHIIQLTWQSGTGFVYDQHTFRQLKTFSYPGEGWGLANDGKQIYMSDGTAKIRCLDASTLREFRSFTVHDGSKAIDNVNELEWVRGEIYANIWQTDFIARIDPRDGRILGWIDLSGLLSPQERAHANVLNGIAYDPLGDRLFVTGKLWPKLFQIRLVRKGSP